MTNAEIAARLVVGAGAVFIGGIILKTGVKTSIDGVQGLVGVLSAAIKRA